jgi:hypothetical protein
MYYHCCCLKSVTGGRGGRGARGGRNGGDGGTGQAPRLRVQDAPIFEIIGGGYPCAASIELI